MFTAFRFIAERLNRYRCIFDSELPFPHVSIDLYADKALHFKYDDDNEIVLDFRDNVIIATKVLGPHWTNYSKDQKLTVVSAIKQSTRKIIQYALDHQLEFDTQTYSRVVDYALAQYVNHRGALPKFTDEQVIGKDAPLQDSRNMRGDMGLPALRVLDVGSNKYYEYGLDQLIALYRQELSARSVVAGITSLDVSFVLIFMPGIKPKGKASDAEFYVQNIVLGSEQVMIRIWDSALSRNPRESCESLCAIVLRGAELYANRFMPRPEDRILKLVHICQMIKEEILSKVPASSPPS